MKNYLDFIKEEIDIRGNKGVPDDFMNSSDRQASTNLGIRVNDPRQMQEYGPQIMQLVGRGKQLMQGNLNPTQFEARLVRLEELAKNVVLSEYGELLDAGADGKPIELDIKFLRPRQNVSDEIEDMDDVPARPPQQVIRDENIKNAVDKKKILNVINQGEAKATKSIIQFSELIEPALREEFGEQWQTILNVWLQTTDVANKLDWIMPIEIKSQMMKNAPEGMAGACQVKWEKDEDEEDNDSQPQAQIQEEPTFDNDVELVGDQEDFNKIVIKAVGVDFPMLIHEAVKGIYQLLKSGAIKDDEELAKVIADNTNSFEDESQDFRYGVPAQAMFRDFINACKDSDKYSNMNARVYAKLALDIDRGGVFTDAQFLETTKSMFASFDLVQEGRQLEFTLNREKFEQSAAKRNIEIIISDIVAAEQEYEQQMREWESDKALGSYSDEDSKYSDEDNDTFKAYLADNDIAPAKSKEQEDNNDEYTDEDLKNMRRKDIQELVDDALDAGDYKSVERYSKFLGEGHEIYMKELKRIYESHILHGRRKKN